LLTPLVSAVITGVTTIGVAFIGIVPQMRNQDKTIIHGYRADIENLQKKVDELTKQPGETWTFSGNIHPVKEKATGNDQDKTVEVYLVPEVLGSHTDSAGDYSIPNVPRADYSLLVRLPTEKTITMHVPSGQPAKTFNTDDGLAISYARGDDH
jgi:hypothetical protein